MLERDIKRQIKNYSKKVSGLYLFHYSAYMGEAGIPDYIGVYNGYFIGIEVKRPGNDLTMKQEQKIKTLREHRARVCVAYSIYDFKKFIKDIQEELNDNKKTNSKER